MENTLLAAQAGRITPVMETIAAQEGLSAEAVRQEIALGRLVVPQNPSHDCRVKGIGRGMRTKINASIGTSTDLADVAEEVAKALAAQEAGADTLMELSVGGDLDLVRREVLAAVELPVGNVPLYQAFSEATKRYGDPNKLDPEELFELIERQCADGISFMAIHCGINLFTLERLQRQGYRYGGLVSKGGASMVAWMQANQRENPLYEQFDRVAGILKKYDAVLSLGNGFPGRVHSRLQRPGHGAGASDQLRAGRTGPGHGLPDDGGRTGPRAFGRGGGQHHLGKTHERRCALLHAGALAH